MAARSMSFSALGAPAMLPSLSEQAFYCDIPAAISSFVLDARVMGNEFINQAPDQLKVILCPKIRFLGLQIH